MIDAPSMTIRGVIQGERFEIQTKDWCEIDRHTLDDEIARQPAGYAYVSMLKERAEREKMLLEAKIEDCDAEFVAEIRAKEKLPEYALRLAIKGNVKRRLLMRQLIEVDQFARELGALVYALVHRKDALYSLAISRGREISTPTSADVQRAKDIILGKNKRTG